MTGNPEVGLGCSLSKDYNNPEKRYAQREEGDILKKAIQGLRTALRVVVQLQQLQERCDLQPIRVRL
jgi:hypothetical protein